MMTSREEEFREKYLVLRFEFDQLQCGDSQAYTLEMNYNRFGTEAWLESPSQIWRLEL